MKEQITHKQKFMSPLGKINYYKKLLNEGRIQIGGPAHNRLKELHTEYIANRRY